MVDRIGAIIDKYPRTAQTPEQHQKDLEDMMAELSGKLPGAMKTFGAGQTPPRRQTQLFNQYQANQFGFNLPKDWQLKVLPVDDPNGMPHYSMVMPDGWEATDYGTFVDPTGKRYTAEQYNALEPWNVPYQREKLVNRLSFSDEMPVTERMRVETEQDMFLETISTYDRTTELEDLLKELFNIDDEQVDELFVRDPLRVDPSAQWPGGYEQKQYYDYIEQTEALTNEPSLSKAITNPSRLPPEEYSLMGFDPGSVWDFAKNVGSVLGAAFEGLLGNINIYGLHQTPSGEAPKTDISFATYFTGAIGDFSRDLANYADVKGYGDIAAGLNEMANMGIFQSAPDPMIEERGWKRFTNPRYYSTEFAQPVAFSMAMIPLALLGPAVAAGVGLGTVGTIITTTLFSLAFQTSIESMTEAGGAARQAEMMGMSREEQERVADEVFNKNMAILGISNPAQTLVGIAKNLPGVKSNPFLQTLFKIGLESVWQGGEEVAQDYVTRMALGEEVAFDYQMQENLIAGGMMGMGMGSVFEAYSRLEARAINNLPEAQGRAFVKMVEGYKIEGWGESAAIRKALDEIAKTPEGHEAVKAALIETKIDEAKRQLDMMGKDDFVIPSNGAIIKSEFATNFFKRRGAEIAKAPGMKKIIDTLFGARELTPAESELTKDVVARHAILWHSIQKMGKDLATAETWILRSMFTNPVKAFGFNKSGFSQRMQDSLAEVYSDNKAVAGTVEHVFTHPEQYHLSEKQLKYIEKVHHIFERLLDLQYKEGAAPKRLTFGWYIHRVSTGLITEMGELETRGSQGQGNQMLGSKPSSLKQRNFRTMAEGIAFGRKYSPNIEDSIRTSIQDIYKHIADKRFAQGIENYGNTPLELLIEQYPELETNFKQTRKEKNRSGQLVAAVQIAARGGALPKSMVKGLTRHYPYIMGQLSRLTDQRLDNTEPLRKEITRLVNTIKGVRESFQKIKGADQVLIITRGAEESMAEAKRLNAQVKELNVQLTIAGEKLDMLNTKEAIATATPVSQRIMADGFSAQIHAYEQMMDGLNTEVNNLSNALGDTTEQINLNKETVARYRFSLEKMKQIIADLNVYRLWVSEVQAELTEKTLNEIEEYKANIQSQEIPVSKVVSLNVSEITVDAERFQFKTGTGKGGTTNLLRGLKWDITKADVILVWKDPIDGNTYVINGHHRLGLAQETGQKTIDARYIPASNAKVARAVGAEANIAQGRGTAIDAAKLFRELGVDAAYLENSGLSAREKMVADGMALANLDNNLFAAVIRGDVPVARGVTIGRDLPDHAQQVALVKLLEKQKRMSEAEVAELIIFVRQSETTTSTQQTLFGEEMITKSLAIEKAQLSTYIKSRLSRDRKLFGYISQERRAARISELGVGEIDTGVSKDIASDAAIVEEVFTKRVIYAGEIADALNAAASELAQGGKESDIKERLYKTIRTAVQRIIGQGEAGVSADTTDVGTPAAQVTPDIQDIFTPAPATPAAEQVTEEVEVKPEIPTQEAPAQIPGEMEAGLQKDIFGFYTEVHPKGKGRVVQISMDDYNNLQGHWAEHGHPGTPPNLGIVPDIGVANPGYYVDESMVNMEDLELIAAKKQDKIKKDLNDLKDYVYNFKDSRKVAYEKARVKRQNKLDHIRQGGEKYVTLPDGMEGNKGYIMQPMFGGKLYNQDFIDSINQFFGHEKGSAGLQFFADVSGILRITKAAFDLSVMLLQGTPAFGLAFSTSLHNPKIGVPLMGQWFRAFGITAGSFINMGIAGKYMAANEPALLERISNGGSTQAVDYFQTLGSQGGLGGFANTVLSGMPLQPFQRAETAFFIGAEVCRTELWKALSPLAKEKGQERELARFLDRMTGVIDTSAMSVPQKMRQFEQAFIWFAPRYTRACSTVIANIFKGDMTGQMARESLGGMISSLAIMTTAISMIQGLLNDEDESAIQRRVEQNFGVRRDSITGELRWSPSAKIMSVEIGNGHFGVGGFFYGLLRLFGHVVDCVDYVGEREPVDLVKPFKNGGLNRDNPLLAWWYSRSSPFVSTFREALYPLAKSALQGELQTGRTYMGTPIETPLEYAYYMASRFTPIWIEQGVMPYAGKYMEEYLPNLSTEYDKPQGMAAYVTPFAEFIGMRAFTEGEWTMFQDATTEAIGKLPASWLSNYYTKEELKLVLQAQEHGELLYRQLPKQAKQALRMQNEKVGLLYEYAMEASSIQDSDTWKAYLGALEEVRFKRNKQIQIQDDKRRNGELTPFEYRENVAKIMKSYGDSYNMIQKSDAYSEVFNYFERLDERGSGYDWQKDFALQEYEDIIYDETLSDEMALTYNYEERTRRIGEWIDKWGMVEYEAVLEYHMNNKEAQGYPDDYLAYKSDIEKLSRDYWKTPYQPLYKMDEEDIAKGDVPNQYLHLLEIYQNLDSEEAQESFIEGHPEIGKDFRAEYRAKHPKEDAMLKFWGYGGDLQTMEAYDICMGMAKDKNYTEAGMMKMQLAPRIYAEKDFEYKALRLDYNGNSAQAKLFRIDNPDWAENWANEAYDWKPLDEIVEVLRINVDYEDQDNEYAALLNSEDEQAYLDTNEEYWTARLVRDAYKNDVEVKYHDKYIEYRKMPIKGKTQERFLRDNPEYYEKVWLNPDVLGNKPVSFDNIPPIEFDNLYRDNQVKFDEYFALTDRGDREDYLYADHDFAVIKYKADAYEKMIPEKDVATYANYMVIPPKAKDEWFINNQKYYNYVSYYEEEWYMIAHPEYHDEVYVTLQGNQPMDFTDVPTREVDKLYKGYLTEKKGSARLDYRALYPDLDKWMLLTKKVSKLVGDRGIPQYSTGPWADAERAKEIIDEYF